MKKSKPFGIIILIVLSILSIFGYLFATALGFMFNWEISIYNRIVGIIMIGLLVVAIYYLINPSEFGWKFILALLGLNIIQTILHSLFFRTPKYLEGMDSSQIDSYVLKNMLVSILCYSLVMVYIYKKKSYFMDPPDQIEES